MRDIVNGHDNCGDKWCGRSSAKMEAVGKPGYRLPVKWKSYKLEIGAMVTTRLTGQGVGEESRIDTGG